MEKITTSTALGELRRMARMYKVFEYASEAADVLDGYEKKAKALQHEISTLEGEKNTLDSDCESITGKIASLKIDDRKLNARIKDKENNADQKIANRLDKAEKQAEDIISNANQEIEDALKRIDSLIEQEKNINRDVTNAQSRLEGVEKNIADFKQSFANS